MEQSRLIIAIGISFAVFFAWSIFFAPKPEEKSAEVTQEQTVQTPATTQPVTQTPGATPGDTTISPAPPFQASEERQARTYNVDTKLYRITLSESGAAVIGMTLKAYRETNDESSPYKELIPEGLNTASIMLSAGNGINPALKNAVFTANRNDQEIVVYDQPVELVFSYQLPSGVSIEKSYRFLPDTYLIDMQVLLRNEQSTPLSGQLAVVLRDKYPEGKKVFGFIGPSGIVNDKLKQVALKKIPDNNQVQGLINWIALEKPYFMSSVICLEPQDGQMILSVADQYVENTLALNFDPIAPGGVQTYQFNMFLGPKSWSLLRSYDNELDRAINFGWVDILAKPCLWFMNFIHKFIPNYGIAIIILTIVSRLLFWPLAQRSYKSMGEMRKLAPLMKELREKYKDDKARLNQESMALYKTYKINPMNGCLPMVIQLPVFFALYRMLYSAIELRHAPFFGWIQDLSAPDRLFHFDFKIPFMEEPTGIPVLTIIMGVTMILQQKMTPTPGDPAQAKMMMLMPVVFMVIFINFSSGLVLYWLISNVVAISQQYFTQKRLA